MTFTYVYKKSDNVRRTGTIEAQNLEAAYAALRKQGIRPIRVVAPPPTILSRLGRRGVAIVVLSAALSIVLFRLFWSESLHGHDNLQPAFRHAVAGIVMDEDYFAILFDYPCERFLAWFAQPGRQVDVPPFSDEIERQFKTGLSEPLRRREDEPLSVTEFRAIVAGMKEEAIRFLRTGCTIRDYMEMLTRRQQQEIAYRSEKKHEYEKVLLRGDSAATARFLESANAELRVMGMDPLPQIHLAKPK